LRFTHILPVWLFYHMWLLKVIGIRTIGRTLGVLVQQQR